MNTAGINSIAFNAAPPSVIQRAAAAVIASAQIAANVVVLSRGFVSAQAEAAIAAVGRGFTRAAAAVSASATIYVAGTSARTRAPVTVYAEAGVSVVPTVFVRDEVSGAVAVSCMADIVAYDSTKVMRNTPVTVTGYAQIGAGVSINQVHQGTVLVQPEAATTVTFTIFKIARLVVDVTAQASASIVTKALRRGLVSVTGQASLTVDFDTIKSIPFDEPAPDIRSFRVPSAARVFYVS